MEYSLVESILEIQQIKGTRAAAEYMREQGMPIEQALRTLVPGWQERQMNRASLDYSLGISD